MNPINFKEATKILRKPENMTDEECGPLPIYTDGINCVSCWKMSFTERLVALLFGKVWLIIISGQTQPPVSLRCERTVFVKGENNEPND